MYVTKNKSRFLEEEKESTGISPSSINISILLLLTSKRIYLRFNKMCLKLKIEDKTNASQIGKNFQTKKQRTICESTLVTCKSIFPTYN